MATSTTSPAPTWQRITIAAPLAAGCAWSAFALTRGLENRAPLAILWGAWAWVVLTGLAASTALCAWAAIRVGRASMIRWASLRDLFCILVVGAVLYVAWAQPFAQLTCDFALGMGMGLFAIRVLTGARRGPVLFERLIFQLCLLVVLAEVGLRVIATITRSPLLVPTRAGIVERLESHRYPPGEMRWGFPCNAGGHYDHEFEPRAGRTGKTIAMIGDSFSSGTVPHAYHFTTVCERILGGVQIYNVGIPGIDPPQYLHLLRTEVLPLEPALIVVNLFVGNDFAYPPTAGNGWAQSWLDRDNVLLCLLPRRLAAVAAERRELGGADVGRPQGEGLTAPRISDVSELERRFPWLVDHALEQPTFSASAFLGIERRRALRVCRRSSDYGPCLEIVAKMDQLAADTPLAVVLIPDEFQVEDQLWHTITSELGERLERDRPQRVVGEILRSRGIAFLDLLPVLRGAAAKPDGDRHLYHLRDTHFNARGNRVAAAALAEFLRSLIE